MQTITTESTVGELVKDVPARSRIFDHLRIDYCCGGKKTLAEACQAKGLDPATVVSMLEAMGDGVSGSFPDADKMTLVELCDYIQTAHHGYIRKELPRLDFMTRKVAAVHGEHEPRLLEIRQLFQMFLEKITAHTQQEDEEIFPAIRALEKDTTAESRKALPELLKKLEDEHENTGAALEKFKALSDGYTPPDWACNTFRALYDALAELERETHQHIHKENNVLFPKVRALAAA